MGEVKSLFIYYQLAYEQLMIMNSKLQIFIPTLSSFTRRNYQKNKKMENGYNNYYG